MIMELEEALREAQQKHESAASASESAIKERISLLEERVEEAVVARKKAENDAGAAEAKLADTQRRLTEIESAASGETARLSAALDEAKTRLKRVEEDYVSGFILCTFFLAVVPSCWSNAY
jgi:chromosome segregation ATPase